MPKSESAELRLYADTHMAKALITQLRQRGLDVVRCEDVGMATASDTEHLAYASANGRAMLTNDQGFAGHHRVWLASGKHHAGIFLVTHNKEDVGMIVRALAFFQEAAQGGALDLDTDIRDQIIFVPWE